jgi:hypothetical protein
MGPALNVIGHLSTVPETDRARVECIKITGKRQKMPKTLTGALFAQ